MIGINKRLHNILRPATGRSVIVPVDDSLIFGPVAGLENFGRKLRMIVDAHPDAILTFRGAANRHAESLRGLGWIFNLTASTVQSIHTRKAQVDEVEAAVRDGADAVAVHVNISSKYESDMLHILGNAKVQCERFGMPLLAIMYPRRESVHGDDNHETLKLHDNAEYVKIVAHGVRVAQELGADIIKTQYTGTVEGFSRIVEAVHPIPVMIAGGPKRPAQEAIALASDAIVAGAAGVSFGRNVFSRADPRPIIEAIKAIVHDGASVESVIARLAPRGSDDD